MEVIKQNENIKLIDEKGQILFKGDTPKEKSLLKLMKLILEKQNIRCVKVCSLDRKVSSKRAFGEIPKIIKEIDLGKVEGKFFKEILKLISGFHEGREFTQDEVRSYLSNLPGGEAWNNTWGDKTRGYLGLLTCMGLVKLNKFHMGKGGHKYIRINESCEYWNKETRKCSNCEIKVLKSGEERDTKSFKTFHIIKTEVNNE